MLALGACTGTGETPDVATFAENCVTVMSDPELMEELADVGATPETGCACMETWLADQPEEKANVDLVLAEVAKTMADTGEGAEDVASELRGNGAMIDEEAAKSEFAQAFPSFNNAVETVFGGMADNGGACPAM